MKPPLEQPGLITRGDSGHMRPYIKPDKREKRCVEIIGKKKNNKAKKSPYQCFQRAPQCSPVVAPELGIDVLERRVALLLRPLDTRGGAIDHLSARSGDKKIHFLSFLLPFPFSRITPQTRLFPSVRPCLFPEHSSSCPSSNHNPPPPSFLSQSITASFLYEDPRLDLRLPQRKQG